jgi:hypothetical protein
MKPRCVILLFLSLTLTTGVLAQCVLDPIHVERIEGYVLFGFQNQFRVLDKAEIRLLNAANMQTVASAIADKDGHFEVVNVKPGKYILSARAEAMIPASVDLEMIRAKGAPGKRLIVVLLAADATKECGGASIRVESRTDVDRVLSTAKRPVH